MSGKRKPNLHRRRSSLPNLKIMPLTMAERRLLARQKRQEEQEAAVLAAQKAAEEKRQRAKQLRKATKAKDSSHRRKITILGTLSHCRYCDEMVCNMEFDEHKVSHPTQIRSRIWLGNKENSEDINVFKKCGITHILNCTKEIELTKQVSKKIKSFKRISIQDKNHETILDYINDSNKFIEKALSESSFNIIFIHCREGRSRSVSFLSAYLMWKEKQSFHAILSDITSKRHIVLPNNKFYSELEKYDKQLIKDRKKNNFKKFGKPNENFILAKVPKYKKNNNNNYNYNLQDFSQQYFKVQQQSTDEVKIDNSNAKSNAKAKQYGHGSKHDRRRSSLSDIDLTLSQMNSWNRASLKLSAGYSGMSGGQLSPVVGSPVTKKKRAYDNSDNSDPWKDVIYGGKSNGKKKKKKSNKKGKKNKKDDLNVEQAMDVTDIFTFDKVINGNDKNMNTKTKKKKKSKKDNENSKKKKSSKKKKKKSKKKNKD